MRIRSKKGVQGPLLIAIIMLILVIAVVIYSQVQPYEMTIKTGELQRAMVDSYAYGAEVRNYLDLSTKYAADQALYTAGAYGGYNYEKLSDADVMSDAEGNELACGFTEHSPSYPYWIKGDSICVPSAGQLAKNFRNSFDDIWSYFLLRHPSSPWISIDEVKAGQVFEDESLWDVMDMATIIDLDENQIEGVPALGTHVFLSTNEDGSFSIGKEAEIGNFIISPKATDEYGAEDIVFEYMVTPHFVYDWGFDILRSYYDVISAAQGVLECISKSTSKAEANSCASSANAHSFTWGLDVTESGSDEWLAKFDLGHTSEKVVSYGVDGILGEHAIPIRFAALIKKGASVPKLLPDVDVAPTNVKFSTMYPKADANVDIAATVWNWGTSEATGTSVEFWAFLCSDPDAETCEGDTKIGSSTISVPAGSSQTAKITWIAKPTDAITVKVGNTNEKTAPTDHTADNELTERIMVNSN